MAPRVGHWHASLVLAHALGLELPAAEGLELREGHPQAVCVWPSATSAGLPVLVQDHRGGHGIKNLPTGWNRPSPALVLSLVIDFGPLRRKEVSLQDLAAGLSHSDLGRLPQEMCQAQLSAFEDARDEDVVMVPDDPEANDTFAAQAEDVGLSWTLGHVVVHTTASSEE